MWLNIILYAANHICSLLYIHRYTMNILFEAAKGKSGVYSDGMDDIIRSEFGQEAVG